MSPTAAEPVSGRSISVIVCDDVAELRELIRLELEEDGDLVVIAEASTGAEALRAVDELDPDVLLLDLAMPDVDGLEVLDQLRREGRGVRVVVFSGYTYEVMGERVLSRGAVGYLEKGACGETVRRTVRGAVV
jgi:CheY-like chemotaxis protein